MLSGPFIFWSREHGIYDDGERENSKNNYIFSVIPSRPSTYLEHYWYKAIAFEFEKVHIVNPRVEHCLHVSKWNHVNSSKVRNKNLGWAWIHQIDHFFFNCGRYLIPCAIILILNSWTMRLSHERIIMNTIFHPRCRGLLFITGLRIYPIFINIFYIG